MSSETAFVTLPFREDVHRPLCIFGRNLLRSTCPAEQEVLCREISRQLFLGDFPFVYAGVLLANHKRFNEAMRLISLVSGNAFANVLTNYYANKKYLSPPSPLFRSAKPFEAWTQTHISRLEMKSTIEAFWEFALADGRLSERKPFAILDVGTGNGILLSHLVNRLARSLQLTAARLFLLDSSTEMLRVATRNCRRLIAIPIKISTIHSRIESLDRTQISALKDERLSFTIAASCLHHLPKKAKVAALTMIRTISPVLLLEELEANHDLPEINSPDLIWSVQHFYNSLITSVQKSRLTASKKQMCINDFLLTEVIGIIANPKNARGNYHALLDQWTDIVCASGFQVAGIRKKKLDKRGLRGLALNLKTENF